MKGIRKAMVRKTLLFSLALVLLAACAPAATAQPAPDPVQAVACPNTGEVQTELQVLDPTDQSYFCPNWKKWGGLSTYSFDGSTEMVLTYLPPAAGQPPQVLRQETDWQDDTSTLVEGEPVSFAIWKRPPGSGIYKGPVFITYVDGGLYIDETKISEVRTTE